MDIRNILWYLCVSIRKRKTFKDKEMKNLVNIVQQPQPQHQPMVNGESMSIKNGIDELS